MKFEACPAYQIQRNHQIWLEEQLALPWRGGTYRYCTGLDTIKRELLDVIFFFRPQSPWSRSRSWHFSESESESGSDSLKTYQLRNIAGDSAKRNRWKRETEQRAMNNGGRENKDKNARKQAGIYARKYVSESSEAEKGKRKKTSNRSTCIQPETATCIQRPNRFSQPPFSASFS